MTEIQDIEKIKEEMQELKELVKEFQNSTTKKKYCRKENNRTQFSSSIDNRYLLALRELSKNSGGLPQSKFIDEGLEYVINKYTDIYNVKLKSSEEAREILKLEKENRRKK